MENSFNININNNYYYLKKYKNTIFKTPLFFYQSFYDTIRACGKTSPKTRKRGKAMAALTKNDAEKYLFYAMEIGEMMLTSGAEVGRVEDSIRRICMAYGARRVDVFTITSSIVTTMYVDDIPPCTQTRRVSGIQNNLLALDELNQLSRDICRSQPDHKELERSLNRIKSGKRYPFHTQLLTNSLTSGCFSVFFGGSWMDMIASAIIGVLLKFFEAALKRGSSNGLIVALLCSSFGGLLSNLAVFVGLGHNADMISIGNIMLLIPGVAFTNSLRDMFSGDIITGLVRFIESVLLAMTIALGFTFANFLF